MLNNILPQLKLSRKKKGIKISSYSIKKTLLLLWCLKIAQPKLLRPQPLFRSQSLDVMSARSGGRAGGKGEGRKSMGRIPVPGARWAGDGRLGFERGRKEETRREEKKV